MAIDPITISNDIRDTFRRYLLTTLNISPTHADLRNQFKALLNEQHRLFRGPYLQGLPPYALADSLKHLVDTGVLPASMNNLSLFDRPDRPLYAHQAEAIKRIRQKRNIVLATGTGSGKTFAFLTPIVASILESGRIGIHAMLLYPMNALVNDQLKTLRRILSNFPTIRFGRYVNVEITPEKERDGRLKYPEATANEVVSREAFRREPPHILITNYAMLEYLLLRADDSPLFKGPWDFVVLDEAHSYSGAKGTEVAYLMRRLKQRVKPDGGTINYVATSATFGELTAARRVEISGFAGGLFDAEIEPEDIITATYAPPPPLERKPLEANPLIYRHPSLHEACEFTTWSPAFTIALHECGFPQDLAQSAAETAKTDFEAGLCELFSPESAVSRLRDAVGMIPDLAAASRLVFGSADENSMQSLIGLVRVCNLARYKTSDVRLVPCRYHFFVRGLNGAFVAVSENGNGVETALYLDPTRTSVEGDHTLELYVCRKCGQPFGFGYRTESEGKITLDPFGSPKEGRGKGAWFLWSPPKAESIDDEDEMSDAQELVAAYTGWYFCPRCARLDQESKTCDCSGHAITTVRLWLVAEGESGIGRCPTCASPQSVTALRADSDAAQAMIAETFYKQLPPSKNAEAKRYPGQGRKLLCFADSRQSAAYFAPYLEDTHVRHKLRWLSFAALRKATGPQSVSVPIDSLVQYMQRLAEDHYLFPYTVTHEELKTECTRALIQEFCLPFGRRQSLEAIGLVAVEVNLGRFFELPQELRELTALDFSTLMQLIQELFLTVRLQKAIELPSPISFKDPTFSPRLLKEGFSATGRSAGTGFQVHSFLPKVALSRQRRSSYLKRVLQIAQPGINDERVLDILYKIWLAVVEADGPAGTQPVLRVDLAPGITAFQIRWAGLTVSLPEKWFVCGACRQWTPRNVLGICPSFGCNGELSAADPETALNEHHYRALYSSAQPPVPLVAKEHTAQLSPALATDYQQAFQDGHSKTYGQINILSSSTTFELGVDLGDLEGVFLRGIPPGPANYQQRAGRAGRGVGTAACVVSFIQPRSHDQHYYTMPEEIIKGTILPPRLTLSNEVILRRHLNALLVSEFVRSQSASVRRIGNLFEGQLPTLADLYLEALPNLARKLDKQIRALSATQPAAYAEDVAAVAANDLRNVRLYYFTEKEMYQNALAKLTEARQQMEATGRPTGKLSRYMDYLRRRIEDLAGIDWISFLADRNILPGYAFPIHSVTLECADTDLRLDRDLRIALAEYVPGATVVAKARLWDSIGIRMPAHQTLEQKWYARCPRCWHVQRHLERDALFQEASGACPVCGDRGVSPKRTKHRYLVPLHGFTTDTTEAGRSISFDRPLSIPTSRVLFVPQQGEDEAPELTFGSHGASWVSIRTSENADFFVFNDGEDGSGRGFYLCDSCGRLTDAKSKQTSHDTPRGTRCDGTSSWKHLGHEFRGTGCRLTFHGTNRDFTEHGFWLSLMYALLAGMSDALGIDRSDIDGVIRPIRVGGRPAQEVVLFDAVPGGAGHVKRLVDQQDLLATLRSAYNRVAYCSCGADTACYKCLRSFGNQYCHDLLNREQVEPYLQSLLAALSANPDEDLPYLAPDRGRFLAAVVRSNANLIMIGKQLTSDGPNEIGAWSSVLITAAAELGDRFVLGLQILPDQSKDYEVCATLAGVVLRGARLFRIKAHSIPPYAILGCNRDGRRLAVRWDSGLPTFDSMLHSAPFLHNRSTNTLMLSESELMTWLEKNGTRIPLTEILPVGYRTVNLKKGDRVDFDKLFSDVARPGCTEVLLQDPYMRTETQLTNIRKLLSAVKACAEGGTVPLFLRTRAVSSADIPGAGTLTEMEQLHRLKGLQNEFPEFHFNLRIKRGLQTKSMHARFALFTWPDQQVLIWPDRGFDLEDRNGLAYGGPVQIYINPPSTLLVALTQE